MELKMSFEGKILKKIKHASAESQQIVRDALRDASTEVMENSIRETPASTGNLRRSIRREFSKNGFMAFIFPVVEYGQRLHGPFEAQDGARSKPFTIPAREAKEGGTLYRWAKKRGANPWAVRAAIAKRGVRFNPFLKRAAEGSESKVEAIFKEALATIVSKLGD